MNGVTSEVRGNVLVCVLVARQHNTSLTRVMKDV